MSCTLPERANLELLTKQAKDLLRHVEARGATDRWKRSRRRSRPGSPRRSPWC
jgi:hypothetical protein